MVWEYPSNFTFLNNTGQNVDGVGTFFQYITSQVDLFGIGILIAIAFIIFLSLKSNFSISKSITSTLFIVFVLGIFLMRMKIIPLWMVAIIGTCLVIAFLVLRDEGNKGYL